MHCMTQDLFVAAATKTTQEKPLATTMQRTGVVHFGDASLSIWEEGMPREWNAKTAWEQAFKRQVFARIVQTLNRIGWTVGPWSDAEKYKCIALSHRTCHKGDLHGELSINGRCIEFEMWQDVTPSENPNGGKYDFRKEGRMPYVLRLEMERTRRRIRDYLCNVFAGYTFKPIDPSVGLMGVTAEELAAHDRRTSGHYVPELGHARIHMASNSQARDGGTIEHGARVWVVDHKGRIITGTAYYRLNNQWQIVTGRYGLTYAHTGDIFTVPPENLRVKRNDSQRRKRLEGELAKAVKAMDFMRAEVLKRILWPRPAPLFHIVKDGAYFRPDYSGYTSNPVDAGKYTEEELKPYAADIAHGSLKAIPLEPTA